jgi:hypothetical protein
MYLIYFIGFILILGLFAELKVKSEIVKPYTIPIYNSVTLLWNMPLLYTIIASIIK